ncbi:uncharacterized protein BT62DRAFT_936766 [Guyanagaster necrorhizus]|uniref:Uncharacterized protein n=1 Tax=Guyanagaster necrorhizus TaxID=856835 RepID=A0A9P7VIU6_9AGAR|nr:uncharacterized protein BT62DRAFT_936766 [Guyanagaster necrorhizus MCA 3950]KAG7441886.1 hypothetical protein BT62DRAFT_936766 [Guyanagaster necrorhizus MCA 3950]
MTFLHDDDFWGFQRSSDYLQQYIATSMYGRGLGYKNQRRRTTLAEMYLRHLFISSKTAIASASPAPLSCILHGSLSIMPRPLYSGNRLGY